MCAIEAGFAKRHTTKCLKRYTFGTSIWPIMNLYRYAWLLFSGELNHRWVMTG